MKSCKFFYQYLSITTPFGWYSMDFSENVIVFFHYSNLWLPYTMSRAAVYVMDMNIRAAGLYGYTIIPCYKVKAQS
jgi:hypothetical protein